MLIYLNCCVMRFFERKSFAEAIRTYEVVAEVTKIMIAKRSC